MQVRYGGTATAHTYEENLRELVAYVFAILCHEGAVKPVSGAGAFRVREEFGSEGLGEVLEESEVFLESWDYDLEDGHFFFWEGDMNVRCGSLCMFLD